jgi:cell wall-associated NlpC family hydrolase
MARQVDGVALGTAAAGALLVYAGITGKSVPHALQAIISGKSPAAVKASYQISGSPASGGGGPGTMSFAGATQTGAAIAADALRYQGTGYTWGGAPANGPDSHDCSSLVNQVLGMDLGMTIPGYAGGTYHGQVHGPTTVEWLATAQCITVGHSGAAAQAGDLAVWQTHMGICLGPDQMISAQNPQSGTRISSVDGFIPEFLFIRRLKATLSPTAPGGVRTQLGA